MAAVRLAHLCHAFSDNEVKNLKEWVVEHKSEVWGMLYGSLPHP